MLSKVKTKGNKESLSALDVMRVSFPDKLKLLNQKFYFDSVEEEGKKVYTLQIMKTNIQNIDCEVLVLHDETTYIKLSELEERYQKMYVASIVHDIRTPLNGIISLIEIASELIVDDSVREYLKLAKHTSKQLEFLTYDITDYSQLEAGKIKFNSVKESIFELAEYCVHILGFNFEKKKLNITKDYKDSLPKFVCIDKNRYIQIMLNFLGNALKFTTIGGIHIIVDYDKETNMVITSVKDSGIGIKNEDMCKLFTMFGKIDNNSSGLNPQGVGFGLAICKRLAEAMGGYVNATSEYGKGSTFTFAIKAKLEEENTKTKEESKRMEIPTFSNSTLIDQKSCNCSQILHVDDNSCNRFILKNYAKKLDLIIDEAENGQDAIDLIQKKSLNDCCKKYKIIIMDIQMPILDGISATIKLRELEREKKIEHSPIVALTASTLKSEEENYYFQEVGFSHYASKPISYEDYVGIIRKYI